MKPIRRDLYLNRLIERRENGMRKVVTGIRRCGKSYLLFKFYYQYLIESGVECLCMVKKQKQKADRKSRYSTMSEANVIELFTFL
mgnify:CR=1 FL=1